MSVVIECPCGVVLREAGMEEVVGAAQRHAREAHDMQLSDEQAREMAHPE